MSSHFGQHLVETLKRKELIARHSLTEFMNQKALKLENLTKYARSLTEKTAQMNQRRQTEATAVNFSARKRTLCRKKTSSIFPENEKKTWL